MKKQSLFKVIVLALLFEAVSLLLVLSYDSVLNTTVFFGGFFALSILFLFSYQLMRQGILPTKTALSAIIFFALVFRITFLFLKPFYFDPSQVSLFSCLFSPCHALLGSKTLVLLSDLGILFILIALLRDHHVQPQTVILYAWNPLVLLEFAGQGQTEAYGLFFLLCTIYFCLKKRNGLFFGSGIISSTMSFRTLYLLPWLAAKKQSITSLVFTASIACTTLFLLWLVKSSVFSPEYFASLQVFSSYSFVFNLLSMLFGNVNTFFMCCGLLGFVIVFNAVRQKNVFTYLLIVFSAVFLLMPSATPRSFVWIIPFLCFSPKGSLLFLNASVILWYTVFISGMGGTSFIWFAQYTPFVLLLGYEYSMKMIRRK